MPKCVENIWPKAPAKEGALDQMSENFQVWFIHINLFKKPNKKNLQYSKKVKLRCYYICFWSFIVYLPKKNGNWKMSQGYRISPTFFDNFYAQPMLDASISLVKKKIRS